MPTKFDPAAGQSLGRRAKHRKPDTKKVLDILHQEEKKRLHVHLPATLHKTLKLRAVEQDSDMTAVVVEALQEYLKG